MALFRPRELLGEGVALGVFDDVRDRRRDVAVDRLAGRVKENQHRDLPHLEAAGQLLVGGLAVQRDGQPGHGRQELLEGCLVLWRAAGHAGGHVDNLERLALLLDQLVVDLDEWFHKLLARARPGGAKEDGDMRLALEACLRAHLITRLLLAESRAEQLLKRNPLPRT